MTNAEWCQQQGIKFSELAGVYDDEKDKWYIIRNRLSSNQKVISSFASVSGGHELTPLLNWLDEEQSILTPSEHDYLNKLINVLPHRDMLSTISKEDCGDNAHYYLTFAYNADLGYGSIEFLPFKKDEMYKSMELEKPYSLYDLGLEELFQ